MSRVALAPAAAAELQRRYQVRAEAEQRLSDYLRGIVDALGIAPERVVSFDDETKELEVTDDD